MNKKRANELADTLRLAVKEDMFEVDLSQYSPDNQVLIVDMEAFKSEFASILYKDTPRFKIVIGYRPDDDERTEYKQQFLTAENVDKT